MVTTKRMVAVMIALFAISLGYFALRPSSPRASNAGSHSENKFADSEAGGKRTQSASIQNTKIPSQVPASVPLKVQYSSPAPHIAAEQPSATPAQGRAVINMGGKTFVPKNNAGHFERITAKLNQPIPIRLSWPDDTAHQGVFVQAVHGGKIDNGGNYKSLPFDTDKGISFTFTPDSGPGTYEILLRRGTTEEALQFWVSTGNPKADLPALH